MLMEASPARIDPAEVSQAMAAVDGVAAVHDLHVWTVTSGLVAMSGHVEATGMRDWSVVLVELADLLRARFGIAHVTLQPEESACLPPSLRGCALDTADGRAACRTTGTSARAPHHYRR